MTQDECIIQMKNVNKIFNTKLRKGLLKSEKTIVKALIDVNLEVYKGEIFSLLGPNGAGKTTCIKVLTTLLLPSSGNIIINGFDVEREANKVRASINAMLMGERSIYWKLTGRQNLEYFGTLYYQSKRDIIDRISQLTDILKLKDFLDRPVESYSSGQKYKVAFAKALINNPNLIFLDEPTATLDPRSAREMRSVIKHVNDEGVTIFLTTHNMVEASDLSSRVAIIDLGKIIAIDTPENLCLELRQKNQNSIHITLDQLPDGFLEKIKSIDGIINITPLSTNNSEFPKLDVLTSQDDSYYKILEVLSHNKLKVLDMKTITPTLEDVFLAKTGRTLAQDTNKLTTTNLSTSISGSEEV